MRSLASLRSNYSSCENVYVLAAVETKIHGCETKSERYRDEAKDYNHRNIIVTLYKGFTLGCIFRETINVWFWFSAFQSKTSEQS